MVSYSSLFEADNVIQNGDYVVSLLPEKFGELYRKHIYFTCSLGRLVADLVWYEGSEEPDLTEELLLKKIGEAIDYELQVNGGE